MKEMGHTDAKLALNVYAQAMRRDEKEQATLGALVEGSGAPGPLSGTPVARELGNEVPGEA
jgi:hypothetical protein